MSIILHFKPLPIPHLTVSHPEAATTWAGERFLEAGVPLSTARIQEYLRALERSEPES